MKAIVGSKSTERAGLVSSWGRRHAWWAQAPGWVPAPVKALGLAATAAACRHSYCRLGLHVGQESCNWCGTTIERSAWASYCIVLLDGSEHVRRATSRDQAIDALVYGELRRGLVNLMDKAQQRHRVHPSHVVSCEVLPGPEAAPGRHGASVADPAQQLPKGRA